MALSVILSILGVGFTLYVLFALAVHALPFFVAVTVGMQLYDSEIGLLAALVSAFLAGIATLVMGKVAFATIRTTQIRLAIGALYAAPAGVAGYHASESLFEIGGADKNSGLVFAWIGAVVVGGMAWARIASSTRV